MADKREENTKQGLPSDPRRETIEGLAEIEQNEDVQQLEEMFTFNGSWNPTIDPLLIKPSDFQSLVNMRYNDIGIEGIDGYTFRNSTAITTYVNIKNGIQLITNGRTQETYVLVHCTDGSQGRIYLNKTAIGSTGDFATSIGEQSGGSKPNYLLEDVSSGLTGRFSKAPGENICYCNGEEVGIWSGEETTIAGAFTTTDAAEAAPIDVTDKLVNSQSNAANIVDLGTARDYMTILTTKKYSLLQVAFDVGEYGNWIEFPYLQISMGYGKLFSFLLSIGKLGITFDIAGRNWRDEMFYASRDCMELKDE